MQCNAMQYNTIHINHVKQPYHRYPNLSCEILSSDVGFEVKLCEAVCSALLYCTALYLLCYQFQSKMSRLLQIIDQPPPLIPVQARWATPYAIDLSLFLTPLLSFLLRILSSILARAATEVCVYGIVTVVVFKHFSRTHSFTHSSSLIFTSIPTWSTSYSFTFRPQLLLYGILFKSMLYCGWRNFRTPSFALQLHRRTRHGPSRRYDCIALHSFVVAVVFV